MRTYNITAFVGLETHTKTIQAKNSFEANKKALDYGHKMSGYGSRGFLKGVKVKPVKK
jgi:hypothetical protein